MHNKGAHQEWTRLGGRPQGTSDYTFDVKKDDAMRNENTAQKIEKMSSEWGGGMKRWSRGGASIALACVRASQHAQRRCSVVLVCMRACSRASMRTGTLHSSQQ